VLKTICSKTQSTLLTMGIQTPETCRDTTNGINHYLLRLVGLALIHFDSNECTLVKCVLLHKANLQRVTVVLMTTIRVSYV
jgi:hypothetical protein